MKENIIIHKSPKQQTIEVIFVLDRNEYYTW